MINGTRTIRWRRVLSGFAIGSLFMFIDFLLDYISNTGSYSFNFNPSAFIPLVIISIIFIPFQASYEELMIRGYLSQGIAARFRSRWIVLISTSLFFSFLHFSNPEVKTFGFYVAMPFYILDGLLFGLVTILDDGIEIATGLHAANNIFISIFVNYTSSVIKTDALFLKKVETPRFEDFLADIVISAIVVAVLHYKYKWDYGILNKKVMPE